jgi:aspartyl-tRNA(Asn)/glutamyl-tRNA(Gln) amidotransferase subunit A
MQPRNRQSSLRCTCLFRSPESPMTALHDLSAAELSHAYAKRSVSPVEATQAALARMATWELHINAMYLIHHEPALAAARAAEARWQAGTPLSPLDGVPITIKENIYTQGDPAPIGAASTPLDPKPADAPQAARVREAGLVILGKSTMPDFGMLSSGLSSVHGITRNPWRLDRNTSGSSSGAGAAAAAGYGPLHYGTDIGGSVRLPATHCGIFALKPSLGRIPVNPPFMGRVTGPMTRSVRDSALLMNIASRPDVRDYMSLPYDARTDYTAGLDSLTLKGLRIGFLPDMKQGLPVHPEVAAAARDAVRKLEQAGAIVEEMPSFLTAEMLDGMGVFFEARSGADVSAMNPALRAKILPFVTEWCTYRSKNFSGYDVMRAYNQVMLMREAAVTAVAKYDFVLSPTSPIPAYEAELATPGNNPHNAMPHIAFTVAYNMSEQPAASLNWTYTQDALPIGVQVIGQRFDDMGVLRLSHALEQLRPAQRAWPEPPTA